MPGIRAHVFSRTLSPETRGDVTVLPDVSKLAEMRKKKGKDIWLFGGGVLFGSLLEAARVDIVELSIVPVLPRAGRPLMSGYSGRANLKLISSDRTLMGIVTLKYAV